MIITYLTPYLGPLKIQHFLSFNCPRAAANAEAIRVVIVNWIKFKLLILILAKLYRNIPFTQIKLLLKFCLFSKIMFILYKKDFLNNKFLINRLKGLN